MTFDIVLHNTGIIEHDKNYGNDIRKFPKVEEFTTGDNRLYMHYTSSASHKPVVTICKCDKISEVKSSGYPTNELLAFGNNCHCHGTPDNEIEDELVVFGIRPYFRQN
jgi:hypothetical protein